MSATETFRVHGLELAVGEPEANLRERALEAAGVSRDELRGFRIARMSLDARARRAARAGCASSCRPISCSTPARARAALERALRTGRVARAPEVGRLEVERVHASLARARVAVLGAGPAGLFAALVLARNGVGVDVIDRGAPIRERARDLNTFHRTRVPNPESNLLFGEGGAGTYSDGKLYTRVDHPLEVPLLEELVACGAPRADRLRRARARRHGSPAPHPARCCARGSRRTACASTGARASTASCSTRAQPGRVRALATSRGELAAAAVVLAPGHSARDTWRALAAQGVPFEAKPFQLGVRIEHPQALVDRGRHGEGPEAALLGPAYYGLTCQGRRRRAERAQLLHVSRRRDRRERLAPGLLCTNGMSNSKHSSRFANAAIVTTLGPREFGAGAFDGVALQESLERALLRGRRRRLHRAGSVGARLPGRPRRARSTRARATASA